MSIYLEYYSYLALILISFLISIVGWKKNTREDNILSCLLLLTFISELIAIILVKKYRNNLILFHFFAPVQFFLITSYFTGVNSGLRKNAGLYISILGVLISIINSIFIQPLNQFNSYYILLEGFIIIALTLEFFLISIRQDKPHLFRNKHLWIAMIFLFFWSMTFSYWALSGAIAQYAIEYSSLIARTLRYVNIITYGGLSIVFFLNKKHILYNGN
jgi:hypothetical protein